MFRQICESYQGLTPADLEELTHEQIYVMCARRVDLARLGGKSTVSVEEARELGVIKTKAVPGGPQSHVQRIRAANKAKKEQQAKMTKRQRRREWEKELKERRARGEKI